MNDAMIEIRGAFQIREDIRELADLDYQRSMQRLDNIESIREITEGDKSVCWIIIIDGTKRPVFWILDETYESFVERYSKARYCARLFECGGETK